MSAHPLQKVKVQIHVEGQKDPVDGELYINAAEMFMGADTMYGSLVAPSMNKDLMFRALCVDLDGFRGPWYVREAEAEPGNYTHWALQLSICKNTACEVSQASILRQLNPLAAELTHARTKFPSNQYMFEALMEEIGEMADAWHRDGDTPHSRHEALQVACVAMRIATEGVNREGEDPMTLPLLAAMESQARDFFASLKHRPDLSARSEPVPGSCF